MKKYTTTGILLTILTVLALVLSGCSMRPKNAAATPEATPAPEVTPSPTPIPEYTVTFSVGDEVIHQVSVTEGEVPVLPVYESDTHYIAAWENAAGEFVSPEEIAVSAEAEYTAVMRPVLNKDVRFAFADSYGLFRPEELWTRSDAARALYNLLPNVPAEAVELADVVPEAPGYDACRWFAAAGYIELTDSNEDGITEFMPAQSMDAERFAAILSEFFAPAAVEAVVGNYPPAETGLTRAVAVQWLCALLDVNTEIPVEHPYYPDIAPNHTLYGVLCNIGAFTGYTAEDFAAKTRDNYLWIDGYLYCWDAENGCFYTDVTLDTLYYDKVGRYTSGNRELDDYVAALIKKRCTEEMDRRAMLESMHKFLRDENKYLVRNHYEPGDSSWAVDEALIMLSTGRGNCYSFAGAFWALGRGLGYNTVVYSGTISKNYDPHGWAEVILDGVPYICDPEIQKQYWASHMYYDTFMLPYDMAIGWQYEAPNRN